VVEEHERLVNETKIMAENLGDMNLARTLGMLYEFQSPFELTQNEFFKRSKK
jgi:hypothetical protein